MIDKLRYDLLSVIYKSKHRVIKSYYHECTDEFFEDVFNIYRNFTSVVLQNLSLLRFPKYLLEQFEMQEVSLWKIFKCQR